MTHSPVATVSASHNTSVPSSGPRVTVLGHPMDLMTGRQVLDWIIYAARGRRRAIVAHHNLHSLYLAQRDPQFARFYERADLIQVDSKALIRFARMTGKAADLSHCATYLDWRGQFWDQAQRYGLRVFYLGGEPGVATGAVRMMEMAYSDVRFSGHDGFFDVEREGADNQRVLSTIRRFAPDILMVGMGMPRQEMWIAENMEDLPPCVVMPVGAAFDHELGLQKAPPQWMHDWGIGWLHRLCHNPKLRLSRYLYEPWFLLKPAYRDLFRRR